MYCSTSFLILNYFWEKGQLGLSLSMPVFKYWMCYNTTWWNMKCSSTLFLILNNFLQKEHFSSSPLSISLSPSKLACYALLQIMFCSTLVYSDFFFYMNYTLTKEPLPQIKLGKTLNLRLLCVCFGKNKGRSWKLVKKTLQ